MAETKKTSVQMPVDYMARDYDSLLKSMRDLVPTKLPEWKEFENEADFGNVLLELFAHMGDILSYYQDRAVNESFLSTAQTRRSIIQHLRLIGYKLATAAPASAALTLTFPATCNEIITIQKGDAFATKSQEDSPSVRFEYTREVAMEIDCSLLVPVGGKKTIVDIPVEEGRLVEDELLGTSDGRANQRYRLSHAGLILRSLGQGQQIQKDVVLLTELGGVIEEWRQQDSLSFSREGQQDYMIEIDENDQATVIFGDGAFGAIPSPGAEIRGTYRVGGGLKGNVIAGSIQTIVDAPQLTLVGAQVTNPGAATGGAEREDIADAVRHAPSVFRSLKRAVTADDYEALALEFTGVGKVRAEGTNWNTVSLFIAPQGGGHVSDVLEANLLAYFEDKRPVSTLIEIQDVDYVQIYVTAEVDVESYYSASEIKEKVQAAVAALLAFDAVDFAQILYLSKFYEAIEEIDGVKGVNISEFRRFDEAPATIHIDGKIVLSSNEIPEIPAADPDYAKGVKVITSGGSQ
jgi:Baseplate J-like protein